MTFEKENEYLRITVILVVSTGFGDNQFYGRMGGGGLGLVVASLFTASRIVVKPIKCEYTKILDNMLLLRTCYLGIFNVTGQNKTKQKIWLLFNLFYSVCLSLV